MPALFYWLLLAFTSDAAAGPAAATAPREGRMAALLCTRPFQWMGEISMSFYLVHELVQGVVLDSSTAAGWVLDEDGDEDLAASRPLPLILTTHILPLIISLLLGWVLTRAVERPLARRLTLGT